MLGYVKKLDLWIPHQLKEIHLMQLISIFDLLLKHNETDPFLKRLITDDKKWIFYNNLNRKKLWVMQDELTKRQQKLKFIKKNFELLR